MMINKPKICFLSQFLLLYLILSFSGCKDGDIAPKAVDNILVINDTSGALYARVKFNQLQKGNAFISYWLKDQDENTALSSPINNQKLSQEIALFMLKENSHYNFRIHITDVNQSVISSSDVFSFNTASVPSIVREFYNEEENQIEEPAEGNYLFHTMSRPGCLFMVNGQGELIWYRTTTNTVKVARVTHNNTLLTLEDDLDSPFADGNIILETTFAGDTLFYIRTGQEGLDRIVHHDLQLNRLGQIVAITNVEQNGLPGDGIIVLNRQGNKIWEWDTFQELEVDFTEGYNQPWGNSLFLDSDNHYLVSFRALSQVWKINAETGDVIWKLGKNGDIQLDNEDAFLFQHFAHRDKENNLLLFDNGSDDDRASSRIISFAIDEGAKTATSVINTFLPDEYYSSIMGSASIMPDDKLLAASAVNGKIIKLSRSGDIEWTLKTADRIYRVEYVEAPFK